MLIAETGHHNSAGRAIAVTAGHDTSLDALRRWDAAVDRLTRTGDLVVASRLADRALPGRTHECLAQAVNGVPVLGGGVSRQFDAGVTVSLLGTQHRNIDVDTTPALSAIEVASRLERQREVAHHDELPALAAAPPRGSRRAR